MKVKFPSVSLLRNLLPDTPLRKKENFLKAVRMYVIIVATYDEDGFDYRDNRIKLDLRTDRDFDYQEREVKSKIDTLAFNIDEWFTYLNIVSTESELNTNDLTFCNLSAKNKKEQRSIIKRANVTTFLNLT